MADSPLDYPSRPFDALLARAGEVERALRGVLRSLRTGGVTELRRALEEQRRRSTPPVGDRDERGPEAPGTGAPILYLPAVAWSYRFQRPQQLARALSRAGHPVLYVEGFLRTRLQPELALLRVGPSLHRLQVRIPGRPDPYRQPLTRPQAVPLAQRIVAGLQGRRPAMVFVQLPFWTELGMELARLLEAPLVYDRIDLHSGFPGVPKEIEEVEDDLLRSADLVCATAGLLAERPRELNERVLLLPNGVDLDAFPAALALDQRPREAGCSIRAGYVGALGPWFDTEAVRHAALALPSWSFALAGRIENPDVVALADLPNVETVGEIPFREVPTFLAGLDVALVPFRDLPLTRAVDPVKLYEGLAAGLPVVARRLPEVERWTEPRVYAYSTPEEFIAALKRAVEGDSLEQARDRRRAAEQESWDRRAAALLETVVNLK